jgi:hypothetical protein
MQAVATKLSGCSSTIKAFPDSVCFSIEEIEPVFILTRVSAAKSGNETEGGVFGADKYQYCIKLRQNIGTPLEIAILGCIHAYTGATNNSLHVPISLSFVPPDCPLSAVEKTMN